jgi:hypothetical protein
LARQATSARVGNRAPRGNRPWLAHPASRRATTTVRANLSACPARPRMASARAGFNRPVSFMPGAAGDFT